MKYQIFNFRTQKTMGKPYACRRRAKNRADFLDLVYGAITCRIIEIKQTKDARHEQRS